MTHKLCKNVCLYLVAFFRCRNRIYVFVAVLAIMSGITTVVNLLVILVLSTAKRLRNSQTTYKLSLAAADLMVGVLVLPTCIYNLTEILWFPLTTARSRSVAGYEEVNGTFELTERSVSSNIRENLHMDRFSDSYVSLIGFFTGVSLFVSVYTLAAASIDRLFAISKPLSYDKIKADKYAKIGCIISWIFAAVFSLIPIITPFNLLTYGISFTVIVFALRAVGIVLYGVALIIPLVIVWIVNIMVYVSLKKHTRKFTRKLSKANVAKASDVEQRLAATLSLMVGVFTFNTLPLWIIILVNFNIRNVQPNEPESLNLKKANDFITTIIVAVLFLLGNSIWNFFIYNIRNKDFRMALKQITKPTVIQVGAANCCRASGAFIRNVTGHGRRKLSSVSLSILNLNKKTATTDEMVLESIPSASQQTKESVEIKSMSDKSSTSAIIKEDKKSKENHVSELSTVSEPSDSVFNSYSADIGVSKFYSSVMRTVKNSIDEISIDNK